MVLPHSICSGILRADNAEAAAAGPEPAPAPAKPPVHPPSNTVPSHNDETAIDGLHAQLNVPVPNQAVDEGGGAEDTSHPSPVAPAQLTALIEGLHRRRAASTLDASDAAMLAILGRARPLIAKSKRNADAAGIRRAEQAAAIEQSGIRRLRHARHATAARHCALSSAAVCHSDGSEMTVTDTAHSPNTSRCSVSSAAVCHSDDSEMTATDTAHSPNTSRSSVSSAAVCHSEHSETTVTDMAQRRTALRLADTLASTDGAVGVAASPAAAPAATHAVATSSPAAQSTHTLPAVAPTTARRSGLDSNQCHRRCYVCKRRLAEIHAFYDRMCPTCAAYNWTMRSFTADLSGRRAVVVGGRIKIGYEIVLKLLRAGAEVIATTRFTRDAHARFAAQADAAAWWPRLHLVRLDLLDQGQVAAFIGDVSDRWSTLDIYVHNAAQTIRRPADFYALPVQLEFPGGGPDVLTALPSLANLHPSGSVTGALSIEPATCISPPASTVDTAGDGMPASKRARVRAVPQVPQPVSSLTGHPHDEHGQPLDLRPRNTWDAQLHEVSLVEAAEVTVINYLSAFHLLQGLRPLLRRTQPVKMASTSASSPAHFAPTYHATASGKVRRVKRDPAASTSPPLHPATCDQRASTAPRPSRQPVGRLASAVCDSAIDEPAVDPPACAVLVSAMEGKFSDCHKRTAHPHTNSAKAALNMLVRTSAREFAESAGILLTAVDTGWVTDEYANTNPERTVAHPPLDEVDGAARVLHPVFAAYQPTCPEYFAGVFLKDFKPTSW